MDAPTVTNCSIWHLLKPPHGAKLSAHETLCCTVQTHCVAMIASSPHTVMNTLLSCNLWLCMQMAEYVRLTMSGLPGTMRAEMGRPSSLNWMGLSSMLA
jgi:hypothetical protein